MKVLFSRCCYSCRKQDPRFGPVLEDNCCQCNFSAVKQTLGGFFENVDIVYTSFVDEVSLGFSNYSEDHILNFLPEFAKKNLLSFPLALCQSILCRRGSWEEICDLINPRNFILTGQRNRYHGWIYRVGVGRRGGAPHLSVSSTPLEKSNTTLKKSA